MPRQVLLQNSAGVKARANFIRVAAALGVLSVLTSAMAVLVINDSHR